VSKSKSIVYFAALLWQYWLLLHFLVGLLVLFPFFGVFFLFRRLFPAAHTLQILWAKWIRFACGIRVHVLKTEKEIKAPVIYVANHNNFLDIIVGYKTFNGYFHYMAKASLAKIPLFGILFKYTHIPLDREKATSASAAYQKAKQDLRRGYSIVIFPEGTQNPSDLELLPFKEGAFKLSKETGIPIVPVRFIGHLNRLPHSRNVLKYGFVSGPGKTYAIVGSPLFPNSFENSKDLMEKTRTIMEEMGYSNTKKNTGKQSKQPIKKQLIQS
jgi:1-acyl-sn-glycerol-3-phosphate acyltransferase